jgi:hypothetical protein
MRHFYFDFASAYGTCWLILMLVALVTWSHVDAGPVGMFGFPMLGLAYAAWASHRRASCGRTLKDQIGDLRSQLAQARRSQSVAPSNKPQQPTGAPSGAGG